MRGSKADTILSLGEKHKSKYLDSLPPLIRGIHGNNRTKVRWACAGVLSLKQLGFDIFLLVHVPKRQAGRQQCQQLGTQGTMHHPHTHTHKRGPPGSLGGGKVGDQSGQSRHILQDRKPCVAKEKIKPLRGTPSPPQQ